MTWSKQYTIFYDEGNFLKMTEEYFNDFIHILLKSVNNGFIYCSKVNITKFLPLTRGRHRLGQNPVEKGLQSVNYGLRSLLLDQGAIIKKSSGNICSEALPIRDDVWYRESFFIEGLSFIAFNEILEYVILNLLKKIFLAMMIDEKAPESLLPPAELEEYLYGLCRKYSS